MADTRTPVAAPRQQFINIDLVRRILHCSGLNGTSRSVLLTVGMHASKERQHCFCSVDTLAHKSGWSRRTVTQHLTRLQQLGYLSLIGHHHSGTCIYQVRLEQLPADVASHQSHDGTGTAHAAYQTAAAATPYSPAASTPVPAPAPAPAVPSPIPAPAQPPVPTPAPPPVETTPAPCAPSAYPPGASCAPPVQELPAPHAAAAHKERVEKGFEEPGKEEGAHGAPPAASPATAAPATTTVRPSPLAVQQDAKAPATAPTAELSADTVGQLNAQRQRNGKDPLTRRDIVQLQAEATTAGLSPQQAAEWVLAQPRRNFFKAEFYAPPAAATVEPPSADALAAVRAIARLQPAPAVLTPEEQAAQAQAAQEHRARLRQYAASFNARPNSASCGATSSSAHRARDTRWAQRAVELFVAGEPVSYRRLHMACEVLGIDPRHLRRTASRPIQ